MRIVLKTSNRKFVINNKKDILEELADIMDKNNIKQNEKVEGETI